MSKVFVVVCEADADFETATDLADRVLVDAIQWMEKEDLEHQRVWHSEVRGSKLLWKAIPRMAEGIGLPKLHGRFQGEKAAPDAYAARRAIHVVRRLIPEADGILLVRDRDKQSERRTGLEQARDEAHVGIPIVIGLAVVEREAWVISAFRPVNAADAGRLQEEHKRLGFDPTLRSQDLTDHKNDSGEKSPKRVIRALLGEDGDRERHLRCDDGDLETLRFRGGENGLAAFLSDVEQKLAPLISHVRQQ